MTWTDMQSWDKNWQDFASGKKDWARCVVNDNPSVDEIGEPKKPERIRARRIVVTATSSCGWEQMLIGCPVKQDDGLWIEWGVLSETEEPSA